MASKFHGEFEVSADFVNGYVWDGVVSGDWLVIGKLAKGGFVALYMADDSREYAYLNLRYLLNSDLGSGIYYDYEIWHVVDSPDWLNVANFDSISLVEHRTNPRFDETLVYLKGDDFPYGLAVLVTPWALYTVKDWQGPQPVSIRDLDNFECVEACEAELPSKHIYAFVDFCENLYNSIELLRWSDLRHFTLELSRLDILI